MCGLAGVLDFDRPPAGPAVEAMIATLGHRGPDGLGAVVSGPVGLGHSRLSIIELSDLGAQPMWSADRRYCLVYNGEVYNAPELRSELRRIGRQFRGRSDTEVVLNALAEWGTDALVRFNGMFALALWDSKIRQLLIARDRFGIKPLYYAPIPKGVLFGSEIKAILSLGRTSRTILAHGLHEYLYYGNSLGERTLFAEVQRLHPGQWISYGEEGARSGRFWSPGRVASVPDSAPEAADTVRIKLDEAVRRHLLSDVPVAAMLSGGVDSSAVVALASAHCAGRLKTFTVGFDFPGVPNEFDKARSVAQLFDTDHTELSLHADSVPELLERAVRCHDQPFGDAANLALLLTAQALDGSVKVVLQGDGGDEIFAGYRRYNLLAYHRIWESAALARRVIPRQLAAGRLTARLDRVLAAMGQPDPAVRMASLLTQENAAFDVMRLVSPGVRAALASSDPFDRYRVVASELGARDPVQQMLLTDVSILLPDIFMEKVDRPMMAHGIEVRVPLLDADLTEYVIGLPAGHKVRRLEKKWILRQALRGTLPDTTLDGRKAGFGVPYGAWLRGPLAGYARDVFQQAGGPAGLLDVSEVLRLLDEHVSGSADHGFFLYKALGLSVWARDYLGNDCSISDAAGSIGM